MRALLWKEFREKRLWIVAIFISIVGPVIFGQGYTFYGGLETMKVLWLDLSAIVVLFFGFTAYSSELSAGTADLLASRPVSWKKILAAKLIVGLVFIVPAVLLAAITYRLNCPEAYIRFATPAILGARAGLTMAGLLLFYLVGLSCSVVLPGMVGALMVFLAVSIAQGVCLAAMGLGTGSDTHIADVPIFTVLAWWLGSIAAAILILRFGITLSLASRAKKFALVALIAVPVVAALDFLPSVSENREIPKTPPQISLSGSGQYALVNGFGIPTGSKDYHGVDFVRLSDMKKTKTNLVGDPETWPYWIGDDAFRIESVTTNPEEKDYKLRRERFWFTAYLCNGGKPHYLQVYLGQTLGFQYYDCADISPDRKLAAIMFTDHVNRPHYKYFLEFIDLENGKKLATRIKLPTFQRRKYVANVPFDWQPGNVIRFIDPKTRQMHLVKIYK